LAADGPLLPLRYASGGTCHRITYIEFGRAPRVL
jgi:hypothetical protein